MPADRQERVAVEFRERFSREPAFVVRSPGRVNLIGEHTDYNDGFVMPLAIRQSLYIAAAPIETAQVEAYSLDFSGARVAFGLDAIHKGDSGWGEYVKGVAWGLQQEGHSLRGWQGVFSSEIPIGAGLSSSAAVEMGAMMAFRAVSDLEWDPVRMARIGQRVENQWIGVNSGIMDQLIIALGAAGYAFKIDCRSLASTQVPLPDDVRVVIIDSATRRGAAGLADSAYNDRRSECEEAARRMGLQSLRDAGTAELQRAAGVLPDVIFRRARHVVTENMRVGAVESAMRDGDLETLGDLLRASHASMRDDFEITRLEIDRLVEIADAHPACIGARMTGGGFGGCIVGLVQSERAEEFIGDVYGSYRSAAGLEAKFFVTGAADGVRCFSQV